MGQGFKNRYESTKFAAEVRVREAMAKGLKAIIIRPAVVVGDSRTGETDKFDGPYHAFNMVERLKYLPMRLPRLGPSDAEVNLVPIDYLVDATIALARHAEAEGQTFQISDPTPLKAVELYDMACALVSGRHAAGYSVPPILAEKALEVPAVRKWLKVPREVLVYFNHKAKYDCTNTLRVLADTAVKVPSVHDYFPTLHKFWQAHKDEPGFEPKA